MQVVSKGECPLCRGRYHSSRFRCQLECQHEMCFHCARSWLYVQDPFRCPYCRSFSAFFYRQLRSHDASMRHLHSCYEHTIQIFQDIVYQRIPDRESYRRVARILQDGILQRTDVWYKPLFRFLLKKWKESLQSIIESMSFYSPCQLDMTDGEYQQILHIFDQVFFLLRRQKIS